MGVKGNFSSFIRSRAPGAFSHVQVSSGKYTRLAIDIPIFMNKYKVIYGSKWRPAFLKFLGYFERNNIMIWCIFDGNSPLEKGGEIEQRRRNRLRINETVCSLQTSMANFVANGKVDGVLCEINRRFVQSFIAPDKLQVDSIQRHISQLQNQISRISQDDYSWAVCEMGRCGFLCATAFNEGEKFCAKLCHDGTVDAVLSDDSDLYVYLCPIFLTGFSASTDGAFAVNIEKVLDELQMTRPQFVDFCIMCGTDFNKNIPFISTKRAFDLIKEHESIERIAAVQTLDVSILNHVRVREIFRI
jgi:5'-3' exonuclease